ncbi:MAG: hypothetical protein KF732_03230 [Flavobacteriales bacterium]|nr:hypothetical protein [Flavobacteriales bacterium]MBX2958947.1 hypothetical protein [Flavobacteriales bacterium]MCL4855734.1 hypothetical protein [Flavobacteriales bacterium]HRN42615.1 hypothetical protein [Vicingus sp.]HRP59472.1 hypothetical protein [Vicingus sp.]
MKNLTSFKLVLLLFVGVIAFSCAKERSPSLHITVLDENGIPAAGATVHAWPSNDATKMGSTVNEAEMDKTGTTDAAGYVKFDFKFSAVLDVDVVYYRTNQTIVYDTVWNAIDTTIIDQINSMIVTSTDSLSAHKVVKIESVRQRSEDNDYRETIKLR